MLGLDTAQTVRDIRQCFVPGGLTEVVAFADERCPQTVFAVHVVPAELAFDAGGNAVGRALRGFDFENMPVLAPDIETAADAAVGADGLGLLVHHLTHGGFCFRDGHDGTVADFRLDTFHNVDHFRQGFGRQMREIAGVAKHGFFHQRIAGADCDAVAAGDATRAAYGVAAIPQDAGMLRLPVDGERFIHLIVLACLDTTAAEDALVRIVAIKRIGVVLFVGLGFVGVLLVFYLQIASCVVHGAVAVTVVADRAVEHVIAEDDIKSFMLGGFRPY